MTSRLLSAIPVIVILISRVGCPLLMQGCIAAAPVDHFLEAHREAAETTGSDVHEGHGGDHGSSHHGGQQVEQSAQTAEGTCSDCCCANQLMVFSAIQDQVKSRIASDASVIPLVAMRFSASVTVAVPDSPGLETISPPPET